MIWKIEFIPSAAKELKKMDESVQKQIVKYLKTLVSLPDPRIKAKRLVGNVSEYHRFRCGDYRIVCKIVDSEMLILAVLISHRKDVYNNLERNE